jgi:hypothetical protein
MTNLLYWFRSFFVSHFGEEKTYSKAGELVERARCHDQVAIATIHLVRENAGQGNAVAKQTLKEVIEYAKNHPPGKVIGSFGLDQDAQELQQSCFAGDTDKVGPSLLKVAQKSPDKAIVTIANACDASALAYAIDGCLEDDRFQAAFANPTVALQWMKKVPHDAQHALILGYILGVATRLQMVRNPSVPLSFYSSIVAEELG